jgi:hypothetical protein
VHYCFLAHGRATEQALQHGFAAVDIAENQAGSARTCGSIAGRIEDYEARFTEVSELSVERTQGIGTKL